MIKLADNVLKRGIINIMATAVKQSVNVKTEQLFKLKHKRLNKNDKTSGIYITVSKDLKYV